jgi:hypothetical protein
MKSRVVSLRKGILSAVSFGLVFALFFPQPVPSSVQEMASSLTSSQETANDARMSIILNKAAKYCRRLENSALDFVCLEEISEKLDYSRDREDEISIVPPPLADRGVATHIKVSKLKQENKYLYDFQFTRKGELRKENRTLLEKNGKKAREEDATLETSVFQVRNVLFGPLGLLSQYMAGYHDFTFIAEELVQNDKIAVIEATPKKMFTTPHGYGRIWIKEDDGSVLKIEWKPESTPNFESLEARAKKYKWELSVILITEYDYEKNGIRFPSRDYSEEAYLKPNGKKFIRSRTSVIYRDYKFFTVETDIKY